MNLLPLTKDDFEKSDAELGQWLVATWLGFQAQKAGIPLLEIPHEWAVSIIEASAKMDSDSVENAPLESAFRKGCRGDYETAGRMLRAYCWKGAHELAISGFAADGIPVRLGRKKGGDKGGQAAKKAAQATHAAILKDANAMISAGTQLRYLAGKLANKHGRTPTAIRTVLKKAGIMGNGNKTKVG